jgi:methionyl-tRNA synthetase
MMNLARLGNKYLADNEPWKVIKTDVDRVKTVLNISLQICANLSIVGWPFLPFTAEKLAGLLNIERLNWDAAGNTTLLKTGHRIGQPEFLFEKIEDSVIEAQVQKLLDTKKENQNNSFSANPAKEEIQYDDFAKMDIRTGTILEAEKVAKTKKLVKLKIDTGIDQRTVVSGIAEYFQPDQLVGRKVSILVNLAPKMLRGIESHGMILMAENPDGSLGFVSPPDDFVDGSEIK